MPSESQALSFSPLHSWHVGYLNVQHLGVKVAAAAPAFPPALKAAALSSDLQDLIAQNRVVCPPPAARHAGKVRRRVTFGSDERGSVSLYLSPPEKKCPTQDPSPGTSF